jgi:hypothetical protein
MIMVIQGTRNFDDYQIFMRAMGTALASLPPGDKQFTVYSAGQANINSMGLEFSNVSERGLRGRGVKIKFMKVPDKWVMSNINNVDYFAYFSKPGEAMSSLVDFADTEGVSVDVFRY